MKNFVLKISGSTLSNLSQTCDLIECALPNSLLVVLYVLLALDYLLINIDISHLSILHLVLNTV